MYEYKVAADEIEQIVNGLKENEVSVISVSSALSGRIFAKLNRQRLAVDDFEWFEHTVFAGADAEQVLGIHDMAAVGVGK